MKNQVFNGDISCISQIVLQFHHNLRDLLINMFDGAVSYIQATFFITWGVVGSADKIVMEWIASEAGSLYTACIGRIGKYSVTSIITQ